MFAVYEILARGGPVMIPIAIVSVLALAVFLERVWTLQRARVFPSALVSRIEALIRGNKRSEALVLCQRDGSAMAMVISVGLMKHGGPPAQVRQAIEERGRAEAGRLDRFVEALGTIAAIAPLLGLLGTVIGMIDVFRVVDDRNRLVLEGSASAGGKFHIQNLSLMAQGIWQALITTAAGLTVAIPTYVGYKYLNSKINRLVTEMEEAGSVVAGLLTDPDAAPPRPPRSGSTDTPAGHGQPDGSQRGRQAAETGGGGTEREESGSRPPDAEKVGSNPSGSGGTDERGDAEADGDPGGDGAEDEPAKDAP